MSKRLMRLFLAGLLGIVFIFTPFFGEVLGDNPQEDSLHVLFLGFEEERLEMLALYSVNHQDQMQSGALFIPTQARVPGEISSFRDYFQSRGVIPIRNKVERMLGVEIAYHVLINNQIMDEVEKITGPIIVDQEKVDLKKIFTTPASPKDEKVMGSLLKSFTQRDVYFWRLPRLIMAAQRHIKTDFPLTMENLWLHYKIASKIPTDRVKKVILPLAFKPTATKAGPIYLWQLDERYLKTAVKQLLKQ